MFPFIVQHVDALITTVVGVIACFYGFRATRIAPSKATKVLCVCGPIVVLFGIFRLFIDQYQAPVWQRQRTSDGFASAEFPAIPQAKQQTDTVNGVSAQRTTLTYDVPNKDIALFLSFSPLPPNEPDAPDIDRIAAVKASFAQQGFSLVDESPVHLGAVSGFSLDFQRDGGKVRMWTRLAYVAGKVYRVVAASTGSHHDDPLISHYMESFRIERTGT